jgi:RNA polymerase sigma factor (sigma-70 family)
VEARREQVEQAMRGDHEAFAGIVTACVDELYSAATLILRDRTASEEAVQEALVRAWLGLPKLRDPDRFTGWLHRLLTNACYDEARKLGRRKVEIELLPAHSPLTSDASVPIATRDALDRAFRRLSTQHRAALILRHYLGLSIAEVARAMTTPLGTAKSRLFHAERTLRAAVEADERAGGRGRGWSA